MKKSTITDLPAEIEAAIPENERTFLINRIIKEARAGEFHDFKNNKYACGKMAVVELMQKAARKGLHKIRQAIINGDYDESPDAEDKAAMKKDWLDNGGSEAAYKIMFGE